MLWQCTNCQYIHIALCIRRIAFCLDVYNEAVRSMSYPPDAYKKTLKAAADKSGSGTGGEEKSIEELIKEMEDDLDEWE